MKGINPAQRKTKSPKSELNLGGVGDCGFIHLAAALIDAYLNQRLTKKWLSGEHFEQLINQYFEHFQDEIKAQLPDTLEGKSAADKFAYLIENFDLQSIATTLGFTLRQMTVNAICANPEDYQGSFINQQQENVAPSDMRKISTQIDQTAIAAAATHVLNLPLRVNNISKWKSRYLDYNTPRRAIPDIEINFLPSQSRNGQNKSGHYTAQVSPKGLTHFKARKKDAHINLNSTTQRRIINLETDKQSNRELKEILTEIENKTVKEAVSFDKWVSLLMADTDDEFNELLDIFIDNAQENNGVEYLYNKIRHDSELVDLLKQIVGNNPNHANRVKAREQLKLYFTKENVAHMLARAITAGVLKPENHSHLSNKLQLLDTQAVTVNVTKSDKIGLYYSQYAENRYSSNRYSLHYHPKPRPAPTKELDAEEQSVYHTAMR